MSRITHSCLSVRGYLSNAPYPSGYEGVFKCDDGTPMTPYEARDALFDELTKGHEVIPCGPPCKGFDYSGGGCPGHEVNP